MKYAETDQIKELIDNSHNILIMQADNPDGDSMGSSLALEQILGDLGKEPYMYCGANIPTYLRYLPGWDRVQKDLPNAFDLAIIVDTSTLNLFENLERSGQTHRLKSKPCVVLDHHSATDSMSIATVVCNQPVAATGELIYELSGQLDWQINQTAAEMLATSILSDSLGLVSESTSSRTIRVLADLVDKGVKLAELESRRRKTLRKTPELVRYKGELLQRIEYHDNNRLAIITIPWEEIQKYSNDYNPSMLVMDDMRLTEGADVAIAFKIYKDGKVTAKIRCNYGKAIASDLATHFGGGGHAYASGFKINGNKQFEDIKRETIEVASGLLDSLG